MKVLFELRMILISCMFSGVAFSQESWTLDDCVAYALEHNLELRDFEYAKNSGNETYRQSLRSLLPSVQGTSEYSVRYGRSVNPNDNSFINTDFFSNNYSLEASLDLFQGFQKLNAIKAAKHIYNATEEETLQQKYLLAFRVMQAFYDKIDHAFATVIWQSTGGCHHDICILVRRNRCFFAAGLRCSSSFTFQEKGGEKEEGSRAAGSHHFLQKEIGRASCRERVYSGV